jgi:hypothetical protein
VVTKANTAVVSLDLPRYTTERMLLAYECVTGGEGVTTELALVAAQVHTGPPRYPPPQNSPGCAAKARRDSLRARSTTSLTSLLRLGPGVRPR